MKNRNLQTRYIWLALKFIRKDRPFGVGDIQRELFAIRSNPDLLNRSRAKGYVAFRGALLPFDHNKISYLLRRYGKAMYVRRIGYVRRSAIGRPPGPPKNPARLAGCVVGPTVHKGVQYEFVPGYEKVWNQERGPWETRKQ